MSIIMRNILPLDAFGVSYVMEEEALLQVPAKLLKVQSRGVLMLHPSTLTWVPEDPSQSESVEIDTHSITGWQKAKGKPMLRIVTSAGPFIFEFDEITIREITAQKLQPFISSASAPGRSQDPHLAAKQHHLEHNKDLRMVYEALVQSGVLSETQFWAERKQLLDAGTSVGLRRDQQVGLASTLMPDIVEGQESSDVLNLRQELIQQIFAERPHVKEAYDRHVPTDMDAKEFWHKYSWHQTAIKMKRKKMIEGDMQGVQEIDDEYADLFGQHQSTEMDKAEARNKHDPVIDLSLDDREVGDGYGLKDGHNHPMQEKASSRAFGAPDIAAEINQHAVVVLQGISRPTNDAQTSPQRDDEGMLEHLKGEKIQRAVALHIRKDINVDRALTPPLKRQKLDRTGETSSTTTTTPATMLNSKAIQSLGSSSVKVLMELHYGGEMKEEDTASVARGLSPADGLPLELLDTLRNKILIVNELLHHFWASYPVNSHAKETHIAKLKDTFVAHFDQMKGMRSLARTSQESALIHQLLKPVQAQINAAIDKYSTELEMRLAHVDLS